MFPVIAVLISWGAQWASTPAWPSAELVHDSCGAIITPELSCPHCHGEVTAANTQSRPWPGARGHAEESH